MNFDETCLLISYKLYFSYGNWESKTEMSILLAFLCQNTFTNTKRCTRNADQHVAAEMPYDIMAILEVG